ncbi:AAA family ATPase [Streptomyces collinus]|uniref:AAA family ATPase n=1 Tax=Streptomyces collinus TaxID=42684 RepID=UPI0037BD9683
MTEVSATLDTLLQVVRDMSSGRPAHLRKGDQRDGSIYAPTPQIRTALQVALITGRPLLLSGPPGCGKSSLASFVARSLGFSYFEFVVTDDSDPQDLLWRIDSIRRLNDAQLAKLTDDQTVFTDYLEPGLLWWALNPETAGRRGSDGEATRPAGPPVHLRDHEASREGAVLLIDEIDKADSSFCNGLLVPLGSRQFFVPEINHMVTNGPERLEESPLVIITTNNERDLPEAFVRRCVVLPIPGPSAERLVEIARLHFPVLDTDEDLLSRVRELAPRFEFDAQDHAHASTAEFLDLVEVLTTLDIDLDSADWKLIQQLVVEKPIMRRNTFSQW